MMPSASRKIPTLNYAPATLTAPMNWGNLLAPLKLNNGALG